MQKDPTKIESEGVMSNCPEKLYNVVCGGIDKAKKFSSIILSLVAARYWN